MAEKRNHRGTDNVLADLGFPDAEELTAKTILAKKLNDVIDGRHDWSAMRELWDRFLQRLVATAPERA